LPTALPPLAGGVRAPQLTRESALEFERWLRVRLDRSGILCDALTGRELMLPGEPWASNGETQICQPESGTYAIKRGEVVGLARFDYDVWYGVLGII
jgi:hypothetical protein